MIPVVFAHENFLLGIVTGVLGALIATTLQDMWKNRLKPKITNANILNPPVFLLFVIAAVLVASVALGFLERFIA